MADNTTMVKTEVADDLNAAIEDVQREFNYNKSEAVNFLLWEGHHAYHSAADKHRLADAKPNTVPENAPRNDDNDPTEL